MEGDFQEEEAKSKRGQNLTSEEVADQIMHPDEGLSTGGVDQDGSLVFVLVVLIILALLSKQCAGQLVEVVQIGRWTYGSPLANYQSNVTSVLGLVDLGNRPIEDFRTVHVEYVLKTVARSAQCAKVVQCLAELAMSLVINGLAFLATIVGGGISWSVVTRRATTI